MLSRDNYNNHTCRRVHLPDSDEAFKYIPHLYTRVTQAILKSPATMMVLTYVGRLI